MVQNHHQILARSRAINEIAEAISKRCAQDRKETLDLLRCAQKHITASVAALRDESTTQEAVFSWFRPDDLSE